MIQFGAFVTEEGDMVVVEYPVELFGVARVHTDPLPGTGKAGKNPAFKVTLQIQGNVEMPALQLPPKIPDSSYSPRAIEDNHMIDEGMGFNEGLPTRLH
jgi:hypothetical protein